MTSQEKPQAASQASPSQPYFIVSLAALAVLLLVLLHQGMQRWSFLPVLAGVMGMTLRWRVTPLLTLICLAGLLLIELTGLRTGYPSLLRPSARGFSLADWLLCGAVLAFCSAQYRIQALQQGSTRPISSSETGWLLVSLPIWAFLAQLCWRLVPAGVRAYGFRPRAWHGIVLIWLAGMTAVVVVGLLSYASQRRLSRTEARLFLQDAFWQETRREQRRLSSWLAWARLRWRRKEKL
jgi:hypothetical protein